MDVDDQVVVKEPMDYTEAPAIRHLFPVYPKRRKPRGRLTKRPAVKAEWLQDRIKSERLSKTPRMATPATQSPASASVTPSIPHTRSRHRRLASPYDDYSYLQDSGSELESDDTVDDEEGGGEFEDIRMLKAVARQLNLEVQLPDEPSTSLIDGADEGAGESEDIDIHFDWTTDFSTFLAVEETYLLTPGLCQQAGSQVPVDLFTLIWDLTIVEKIVDETNKYAWQTIAALSERGKISASLDSWKETTVPEIYRYFAVLIYMSLNPREQIYEYWTTSVLGMPDFRRLMPRNRFQILSRFLHFTDNDFVPNDVRSYARKVAKISPLLEHCNKRFYSLYTPNKHLSIDESLLSWKGRLSWVQCIRTKAARFGIRSFEVCEATTGYMLRCIIYAGKDSMTHEGSIHGFAAPTEKVVFKLMEGFLDVGHCLVMDNWYNQLPLTRYLKQRSTDIIGTLDRRKRHVPAMIKDTTEGVPSGHHVSCHCGDLSLTLWKDKKLVCTISTYHDDQMVPASRSGYDLDTPVSVSEYNKYMGGVDLKDQKLSMYMLERKRGLKWYIKVFKRLLNTSILNSYIIYLKHPMHRIMKHREFRYKLAEGLCEKFPMPENVCQRQQRQPVSVRLDGGSDHYPVFTAAIVGKPSQHARRRCTCCTAFGVRTQVTTLCQKCQVPLCIGQCWIKYHTLKTLV